MTADTIIEESHVLGLLIAYITTAIATAIVIGIPKRQRSLIQPAGINWA